VTVYVPAGDRRNSFEPANYLLIKAKLDANCPTENQLMLPRSGAGDY
jgi:hypothetical protein